MENSQGSLPPAQRIDDVIAPGLSFATHLVGSVESVKRRSSQTQSEYGEVHRALKELAAVEEAYGKGLKRVAGMLQKISKRDVEFVGFADAMDAVRSNLNHGGDMHISLGYSVSSELAQPLAIARSEAQANAKNMTQRASAQHKQLKAAEEKRKKTAARAVQLAHEAANHDASAREAMGGACQEEIKSPTSKSSGHWFQSKLSSALAAASGTANSSSISTAAERSQDLREQAAHYSFKANEMRAAAVEAADSSAAEARRTALEAQRVLCEFQRNEESCIAELRDALRKLCVFVSSALSSRHYDLQSLARVLDDLEPATEIERFIRRLMNDHGPPPLTIDTTTILTPLVPASIFSTGETPSFTSSSSALNSTHVAATPHHCAPPAHRVPDTIVRLPVLPPPDKPDLPVASAANIFLLEKAAQRDANLITGVRIIDPVSGGDTQPSPSTPQDIPEMPSSAKEEQDTLPKEKETSREKDALTSKEDIDESDESTVTTTKDNTTTYHPTQGKEQEAEDDDDELDEDDTAAL